MNPDYKKIYTDIIEYKKPEKAEACEFFLQKERLTVLDVIALNKLIFGTAEQSTSNSMFRSYNKESIFHMLDYQKKNNLNNSQLALKFKMSRNTVAKWKKTFLV
ncbi:helix-turn-helix domain-containing protein [Chryseobacterium sediminis]|uniref:helix-turn-helix domain-containing protein n=1 Tax=Chryseobacterium sediminis TaxID=1679494 RepID=UPI00285C13AD|nr:helix-turn-helix domain-containing protein [Chryseobacterium sediminis]MDR6465342.1 hypothetical protein [Chryseobacterium sediminis]